MAANLPFALASMLPERRVRILVIEDNPIDREIYKQCLNEISEFEFDLAEAASGSAGVELAQTFRPDCILLDYDLPDGNGLEVVAQFKRLGYAPAIVMLTAFGCEGLAVQAMKAGVSDYLPKSQVSSDALALTILSAIQKFEMQRRFQENLEALERSERRYATMLEAIPQMVWTSDNEGVIQYANRQWLDYLGLSLESAGRMAWDAVIHPEDAHRTAQAWKSAQEAGAVFEIEHRLRRASDGAYRWHLVRAVPMVNRSGDVAHWFGTCTEIEDQKRAERAIVEKEKLETLGMLAGGIAHDFNNLLVGILGGASLAADTLPAGHSTREILNEVVRAGEQAAELTRKMLAYSGRGNLFVEKVDLDGVASDTCRFLRHSIPAGVRFQYESGRPLPPVVTDAEQLRHLIVELVTNGVEAIGGRRPASIWVRTRVGKIDPALAREAKLDAASAQEDFVALEVEDTGSGMDETTQARIFDPFFSTKFTGRGLGLSAVKGFVRSSGGAIRVRSKPGEGSTFQVVLPAAAEKPGHEAAGVEE